MIDWASLASLNTHMKGMLAKTISDGPARLKCNMLRAVACLKAAQLKIFFDGLNSYFCNQARFDPCDVCDEWLAMQLAFTTDFNSELGRAIDKCRGVEQLFTIVATVPIAIDRAMVFRN